MLASLHQQCFDRAWTSDEFESFFDRDNIISFIAYDNDTPVGFVFAWVVADQCELLAIAVLESHRGKGYAKALVELLNERATALGAKQIFLEVSINNKAARKLYEEYGFEVSGRRSNYYRLSDGSMEDAVTMVMGL